MTDTANTVPVVPAEVPKIPTETPDDLGGGGGFGGGGSTGGWQP